MATQIFDALDDLEFTDKALLYGPNTDRGAHTIILEDKDGSFFVLKVKQVKHSPFTQPNYNGPLIAEIVSPEPK